MKTNIFDEDTATVIEEAIASSEFKSCFWGAHSMRERDLIRQILLSKLNDVYLNYRIGSDDIEPHQHDVAYECAVKWLNDNIYEQLANASNRLP